MLDQQLQAFFHSSSFLKTLQTEVTIVVVVVVVVVVDKTNKNSIAVKYTLPLNAVTMNLINHLFRFNLQVLEVILTILLIWSN